MTAPTVKANEASPLGTLLGARFRLEEALGEDGLGAVFVGRDEKTKRKVRIRILAPHLFTTPQALEVLRQEIRFAVGSAHKSLASVYGMGNEGSMRYVACEWVDGSSLPELIRKQRESATRYPLQQSMAWLAQLAEALIPIHARGHAHGALRPQALRFVGDNPKLEGLGLECALLRTTGPGWLGESKILSLAPELRNGPATPTPSADVFGLGGLLYALVCQRFPDEPFVLPSQAHPEASAAVDALLLRCLAVKPEERFASAKEFLEELRKISASEEEGAQAVEVPISIAPPPPQASGETEIEVPLSIPPPASVIASDPFAPVVQRQAPSQSAQVDLSALLKRITENDAPRWMVQKDGLDHGPFSGRELVDLIAKGEVRGEHALLNMDTGVRKRVDEWEDFAEFAEQYRLKAAREAEARALAQSAQREAKSNVAKAILGASIIGAMGILIGVYLYTRKAAEERQIQMNALADLYARGEVKVEGTAGILPDPPKKRSGGARKSSGGFAVGGNFKSYEEAMAEPENLGDISQGAAITRLTPSQIASTMNAHLNSMFDCVSSELRSGHELGKVRIDLAIAGSGEVLGASVRAGSPEFQRCIQSKLASIRFPSFGAPRMGASFSFDASD
ncbi:MAG: hypothetical protein NZM37_04495 [Sandaracinaceae bacterium]|nr:hypothetical protein [Sandaracinaceae bacterium]